MASRIWFQETFAPLPFGFRRQNKGNGTDIFNGYAHLCPGSRWIIINVKMEIPAESYRSMVGKNVNLTGWIREGFLRK